VTTVHEVIEELHELSMTIHGNRVPLEFYDTKGNHYTLKEIYVEDDTVCIDLDTGGAA
jgi:hypothetical protein